MIEVYTDNQGNEFHYEDGELNKREVALKIMANLHLGRYKLIRHKVRIHE